MIARSRMLAVPLPAKPAGLRTQLRLLCDGSRQQRTLVSGRVLPAV
jgi:hypothetical protein